MREKHDERKVDFDMKIIRSFQHNPLKRQCAEAVWIRKVDAEKRINNKNEYHQPGEVEVRYEKGENENIKRRKIMKNMSIQESSKYNENAIYCEHCDYKGTSQDLLETHTKSVHKSQPIKCKNCEHCDYKATSQSLLEIHTKSVHKGQQRKCNKCDDKASSNDLSKTHTNSVHEKEKISLDIRDFLIKTRKETEKHETSNKAKENIMKDGKNNDEEISISTQEMIQDARERREKKMTVFKCEQCDYSSSSKTLLKRHMSHNHNHNYTLIETTAVNIRKRFNCEKCNFTSTKEHDVTNHINTIHVQSKNILKEKVNKSGTSSKRIHCMYCDKKFNKKETFEKHMTTFHGEENAEKRKQLEGHNILSN